MPTLHLLVAARGHAVVAQVVESKLAVRAVGDVALILRAADIRRLIMLNDPDSQSQERVELPHPLGIAAGQVVVDRHEMRAPAGQSVQIDRGGGDERLAFAGGHFSDAPAMQHHATDELDVEVHHRPGGRLVADGEGVLSISQTASGVLHHRKRLGKNLLQTSGQHARVGDRGKLFFPCRSLRPQGIIGKLTERSFDLIDLLDERLNTAQLALIFRADDGLENPIEHETIREQINSRSRQKSTAIL